MPGGVALEAPFEGTALAGDFDISLLVTEEPLRDFVVGEERAVRTNLLRIVGQLRITKSVEFLQVLGLCPEDFTDDINWYVVSTIREGARHSDDTFVNVRSDHVLNALSTDIMATTVQLV